jgi:hypothetical protein
VGYHRNKFLGHKLLNGKGGVSIVMVKKPTIFKKLAAFSPKWQKHWDNYVLFRGDYFEGDC